MVMCQRVSLHANAHCHKARIVRSESRLYVIVLCGVLAWMPGLLAHVASALVSYPGGHRSEEKGWRRSRCGLQCRPAGTPAPSAAMTERTDQPS